MINESTNNLLRFIDESPSPWHCVQNAIKELTAKGYSKLTLADNWKLKPSEKYFVDYSSSLIAFITPKDFKASNIKIVGAHTDSPNLRIKTDGENEKSDYKRFQIEVYGGVLLNSWIDRDLNLAGKACIKNKNAVEEKLFFIRKTIGRIPQLAIHLNREVNSTGYNINPESELIPIIGLSEKDSPNLKDIIAKELGIEVENLISFEACFNNTQLSSYGGMADEFIFAPRLDNQASCHAGLASILASTPNDTLQLLALFDHEEVGSRSSIGADSNILQNLLRRIYLNQGLSEEQFQQILPLSYFLSADMAHALHPNYEQKHGVHRPKINQGPVIKINQNQRYATDDLTYAKIKLLAERNKIKTQLFYSRNDQPCGSTIGPHSAAHLNMSAIDMGNPMLSMHSIREMAGSEDHPEMIRLMSAFYKEPF